jgi:MIP family channel proteins
LRPFPPSSRNQFLSEFLGTYLLVLIGPGSVVAVSELGFTPVESSVAIALVFGCVVAGLILILGRISGALVNPAITLATATAGSIRTSLLVPYVTFQVAGALLAGLTLEITFGSLNPTSLGSTKLAAGISPVEGVILEIAGTFVLASSALIAGAFLNDHTRAQAALVGVTLFVLILLVGPLTGASFNPARSLGPSIFSGYFQNQLIYYVGPLIGGLLAGLAFTGARRNLAAN